MRTLTNVFCSADGSGATVRPNGYVRTPGSVVSPTRGQPALARASIGSVATIEVSAEASALVGRLECRSVVVVQLLGAIDHLVKSIILLAARRRAPHAIKADVRIHGCIIDLHTDSNRSDGTDISEGPGAEGAESQIDAWPSPTTTRRTVGSRRRLPPRRSAFDSSGGSSCRRTTRVRASTYSPISPTPITWV